MPTPVFPSYYQIDVEPIRAAYPAVLSFKYKYEILNKVCSKIGNEWGLLRKLEGEQYNGTHPGVLLNCLRKEIVYALKGDSPAWEHLPWNDAYIPRWVAAVTIPEATDSPETIDMQARARLTVIEAKLAGLSTWALT
jgi:hypothetical protein